ncbi:MAG: hypothetical protein KAK00_08840 [Nanoarchaeota archaeon]|nr:hypothetical protein [Nanoarchaeota archaeon]
MVEFNPDGSIKLPSSIIRREKETQNKMKNQRCISVRKDIISDRPPKSCNLIIRLSDKIIDFRFIDTIFTQFKIFSSVPIQLKKISDREYLVEVGTHFKRCSDCNSLISRYREFLDGNLIEDKGTCTYKGRDKGFCYEDYFD